MDINNTNQTSSPLTAIKTLVIEIGIILFLTILVLATLNYLKIIDIKALFATQPNTSQNLKINQTPVSVQPPQNPNVNRTQANSAFLNLGLISRNKGLHYASLVSEFEGKINTIDTTGGTDSLTKLKYQVRLELTIGTSSATTVVLYPQEASDKIKILDSKNKVLTLKDLKISDVVTIKTNTGTLRQYPDNFNEVVITKL